MSSGGEEGEERTIQSLEEEWACPVCSTSNNMVWRTCGQCGHTPTDINNCVILRNYWNQYLLIVFVSENMYCDLHNMCCSAFSPSHKLYISSTTVSFLIICRWDNWTYPQPSELWESRTVFISIFSIKVRRSLSHDSQYVTFLCT
jgi:hypothetical protein